MSTSVDSSAASWAASTLAAAEAYAIENDPIGNPNNPPAGQQGSYGTDGVDGPSASQRALDAFWGNDPNRPASTMPGAPSSSSTGTSGSSGPGSDLAVELTQAEVDAIRAAGSTVTPTGDGRYVIDQGMESINITQQAPPPPPAPIVIMPDHQAGSSGVPTQPADAGAPDAPAEPAPAPEKPAEPTPEQKYAQQRFDEAARLKEAQKHWPTMSPEKAPKGVDVYRNMELARQHMGDLAWFYEMVKSGGEWDYKKGGHPEFEDFGNYNFGAVGRAMGIPESILERGAGWYQSNGPTANDGWGNWYDLNGGPYGDDPVDQFWISQGFNNPPPLPSPLPTEP
jgi:hypothetical protein